MYIFLVAQLESGSQQASAGLGSRFLPIVLAGLYLYHKPWFVIIDLKAPDCGFNHSCMMVEFYLRIDKDLCGLGKGWF